MLKYILRNQETGMDMFWAIVARNCLRLLVRQTVTLHADQRQKCLHIYIDARVSVWIECFYVTSWASAVYFIFGPIKA